MPKVIFKLDYQKDAKNYWQAVNFQSYGKSWQNSIPLKIQQEIKGKSWEESKSFLFNYLKEFYKKQDKKLKLAIKQFSEIWKAIEKEYFKRLIKITKRKIYRNQFIAYLTTIDRCPYDSKENWFMVNLFSSGLRMCQTAGHELMHLQFHHYFEKDLINKMGREKFGEVKEALTVLLNEEFKDLWIVEDRGYEIHQELRKKILEQWGKKKDFDELIKAIVK